MIEHIAIILLLNLLFFYKTLRFAYCSDDLSASQRPKHENKLIHWLSVIEGRAMSRPDIDHLITTVLHGFVCMFIYLAFGASNISFFAALLFMVNPANNQGSVWISGRSYLLSTLGITGAMAIPWLSPLFLLGATYYNAGFASALLVLGSATPIIAALVPLCWMFHMKRFKENVIRKAKMEMFDEDKKIHPKKLILFTKTFGFYLWHAILPTKNTFYHEFLQSLAGSLGHRGYTFCRWFWFGLASMAGIAWYLFTHEWSMISFGLVWWCFGIAPFLNMFRIHQEIAERYMYLPNVGLMIVLASILVGNPIFLAVFLTMYATKMWFYMNAYKDDYYLVEISCMNNPNAWFSWHVRAMKRWDMGSRHEAIVLWTVAKQISPREFKLLFNLHTALRMSKNEKEGLMLLDMAERNIPKGQEKMAGELIENARKGNVTILL
jgi:hypothetical protein